MAADSRRDPMQPSLLEKNKNIAGQRRLARIVPSRLAPPAVTRPLTRSDLLAALIALTVGLALAGIVFTPWARAFGWMAAPLTLVLLAVAAASKGAISFGVTARRPSYGPPLLLGAIAPAAAALKAFWPLEVTDALWLWLGVSAAVGLLVARVIARLDAKEMGDGLMIVASTFAAAAWVFGLAMLLNDALPERSRKVAFVEVLDMTEPTALARRRDRLWLGRPGAPGVLAVKPPRRLHKQVRIGDCLKVVQAEGALGIWWRRVELCSPR
jgi:hypothetical protein